MALPASPVVPVTITEYAPDGTPDPTVNDPDAAPAATVQSGVEIRPLVDEVIEHPTPSPAAKFVPVTSTVVPARPEFGSNEIPGVTVKLPVPTSSWGALPVSVKTETPGGTGDLTTNVQVMVPPLAAEQGIVAPVTGVPPIVEAAVSANAKPVPVTVTDAPTGAEAGEAVTTCGITFSVVDAETVPSVSVRV